MWKNGAKIPLIFIIKFKKTNVFLLEDKMILPHVLAISEVFQNIFKNQ